MASQAIPYPIPRLGPPCLHGAALGGRLAALAPFRGTAARRNG
jgi:hypothetical protein